MEKESRMVAAQDWGAGLKSGEQLLNGNRDYFWGEEILKLKIAIVRHCGYSKCHSVVNF